jgi:hypothetical protein
VLAEAEGAVDITAAARAAVAINTLVFMLGFLFSGRRRHSAAAGYRGDSICSSALENRAENWENSPIKLHGNACGALAGNRGPRTAIFRPHWGCSKLNTGCEASTLSASALDNRPMKRRTDHEFRGLYQSLRKQFRRRCIAERCECFFNDGVIDFSLRHPHPGSFTVHHTEAVALRPDLELEVAFWAPAHAICNKLNQAAYDVDGCVEVGDVACPPGYENGGFGVPSQDWMSEDWAG